MPDSERIYHKSKVVEYHMGWEAQNLNDAQGNPAGGYVSGCGISITWQNGPVNRMEHEQPNGTFVEDILEAVALRLQWYQDGRFPHDSNAVALVHVRQAIDALMERRKDRQERGVEGKHAA